MASGKGSGVHSCSPPKYSAPRSRVYPTRSHWNSDSDIFFFDIHKIFILKDLDGGDRLVSAQDIEPQGLTAKIFWNKDLAADFRQYFLLVIAKIFILKHLLDGERAGSGQNLEP